MALTSEETIAVVAGSVAGLIVLLAILAVIIYLCTARNKRRRKSRRNGAPDQKHYLHHQINHPTDLGGSKHGSRLDVRGDPRVDPRVDPRMDPRIDPRMDPRMDPRNDPRLPKVGSSNLWFGTPSMYSGGPAPAYQDVRKGGKHHNHRDPPSLQGPPGHMAYPNNMRIYHSQQVGASQMYDPAYRLPARSGSYMDLYTYPYNYEGLNDTNNSRAMLVEYADAEEYFLDPYREREVRRTGRRVRRSQSDVTLHSTRRGKKKTRGETPFDKDGKSTDDKRQSKDRESSKDRGNTRDSRDGHRERERSKDRVLNERSTIVAEVHKNKRSAPAPPPTSSKALDDARKISDPEISPSATDSAKLRALEREREKENQRLAASQGERNYGFSSGEKEIEDDLHMRPYTYEGKPSAYETAAVARMAQLMKDSPIATVNPTRQPTVEPSNKPKNPAVADPSVESFHAEVSRKLEKIQDVGTVNVDLPDGPIATSTGKHSRSSRPTSAKGRRDSVVTDQDGKIITQEAFEFLDTYSDGEGSDFQGSGRVTPRQMRDYDVAF